MADWVDAPEPVEIRESFFALITQFILVHDEVSK